MPVLTGPTRIKTSVFNDFKYILGKFPFLESILLCGLGEPFLNKDFIKMIRYLKEREIGTCFNTNFTLVSEKIARELINSECDLLIASIDGATKQTYEKI